MRGAAHRYHRILAAMLLLLLASSCSSEKPVAIEGGESTTTTNTAAVETLGPDRSTFTIVAEAQVATIEAYADEGATSPIATLSNPNPRGAQLAFRVVDGGAEGNSEYIQVHLPVQPNGTTGWIKRDTVQLFNNPYRVEIDRDAFSMQVYKLDELWIDTTVAIGTGDTPTPIGDFYLMELLEPPEDNGPYGPYAFGLSGFSEVLDSFGGADTAIIGLHGTNDPASLGTNVSHGCVRVDNAVIEQLASTLPLGTPVLIT